MRAKREFVCQRKVCGKTFMSHFADAKYCDRTCADNARKENRLEKPCALESCGKTFKVRPSRADQRFCSIRCGTASRALAPIECPACEKVFKPKHGKTKFCSRACSDKGQRYRGPGPQLPIKQCECCGRDFQPKLATRRFCSRECGGAGQARRNAATAVVPSRRPSNGEHRPLPPVGAVKVAIPDAPKQREVLIWRPESWGGSYYATIGSSA
jgi:hypothetical protein